LELLQQIAQAAAEKPATSKQTAKAALQEAAKPATKSGTAPFSPMAASDATGRYCELPKRGGRAHFLQIRIVNDLSEGPARAGASAPIWISEDRPPL
jgi:hypothetical protein